MQCLVKVNLAASRRWVVTFLILLGRVSIHRLRSANPGKGAQAYRITSKFMSKNVVPKFIETFARPKHVEDRASLATIFFQQTGEN